jgi:hypothetical protein
MNAVIWHLYAWMVQLLPYEAGRDRVTFSNATTKGDANTQLSLSVHLFVPEMTMHIQYYYLYHISYRRVRQPFYY